MDQHDCYYSKDQLKDCLGRELLISLKASQLSILNQTFRPLLVAKLEKVDDKYIYLACVNIRMQNAPEFVFPTPLIVPIEQIAWYMEFDRSIRFSLY